MSLFQKCLTMAMKRDAHAECRFGFAILGRYIPRFWGFRIGSNLGNWKIYYE
jgi:hypothetical protein